MPSVRVPGGTNVRSAAAGKGPGWKSLVGTFNERSTGVKKMEISG